MSQARYGWIIDTDHTEQGPGDAGTKGPHNIPERIEQQLDAGKGRPFRMYDADAELYYAGRIITNESAGTEDDFGPLDDYGKPNAGCVEIHYRNPNGLWTEL